MTSRSRGRRAVGHLRSTSRVTDIAIVLHAGYPAPSMVNLIPTPLPREETAADPALAHETDTWWRVLVVAGMLGASRVEFSRPSVRCLQFLTASGTPTDESPPQPPIIIRGQMAHRALLLLSPSWIIYACRRVLSRWCDLEFSGEFELIDMEAQRVRWRLSYREAELAFQLISRAAARRTCGG